ncbi:hypothetical protein MHU86_15080 [Fragilaria crotonensis]|nr:hypothetical protein MHU86_15080 [Fragilaria crotonensis]
MENRIRQEDNTASMHLSAIHKYVRAIWLGRNDTLHKHRDAANAIKYSAESTEIRHYFSDPLLLPAEDRHYVSNNLDKLLRSSPSVRRRWLRRVRTARNNMLKNGKSQLIRTFFPKATTTDPELPRQPTTTPTRIDPSTPTSPPIPKNIERTPGRPPDTATATCQQTRTRTTQQRMTAFFPGQPPDTHNGSNHGNPSHI